MIKAKGSYEKYLNRANLPTGNQWKPRIIPHGYTRFITRNARVGFPNFKRPVPRYWFT